MSTATSAQRIRHSASRPCPVCRGYDGAHRGQGERCHGYTLGGTIYCSREELAGQARPHPGSETWMHRASGPCDCGQEHAPAEARPGARAKFVKAAGYEYRGLDGKLVYEVEKSEDKRFRQRRPDPNVKGQWIWDLKGVSPIPYRLPELAAADPDLVVFIAEGEKDVLRLVKFGLVATTNSGGAGKWRDAHSAFLKGRDVVILPDNDAKGREHAELVAASLSGLARSVKVLALDGLPEKGDVSDWLDRGHAIADLKALATAAPLWTPAPKAEEPPPTIPIRPPGTADTGPKFHLTDLGNGERLIHRHGINLRYCHPWKKWLTYDGKRWAVDSTATARRWAKDTARSIYREAAAEADEKRRKEIGAHAVETEKRDRLAAMLTLAEMDCPILPEDMDLDPWSFNVLNGTIDLRSGKLRPHRREDLITKICRLKFDPAATCPLWDATLALFLPDADLVDYFQRLCGYALCGVVQDHVLPVCYGDGSNGKSTLLGTLLWVFGTDYAMKATSELLMAKKHATHTTDKTDLFGKRLVVAIETEDSRRLDEVLIKELTGGDRIRARRMREDNWEFDPTHTLMLATNYKPAIRGTDNGIWRRLRLLPFSVQVDGPAADKAMSAKLKAEYPGILAWCVRGCLAWQERGLDEPEIVADATDKYREEQDVVGRFLNEFTILSGFAKVKAGALYERYRRWVEESGERIPLTQRAFGEVIEKRGIKKARSGGIWYQGIGLRPEDDNTEEGAV